MMRIPISLLAVAVAVAGAACGQRQIYYRVVLGLDDPCTETAECRTPLICGTSPSVCTPSHAVPEGGECVLSADCIAGHYCARGVCAPAGNGRNGEVCSSTAQCRSELYCAFEGLGGTCRPGGTKDLGDDCAASSDCVAAMVCDPLSNKCAVNWSAPAGNSCARDLDCVPDLGILCLADTGTTDPADRICTGTGPDGQPVPPWGGVRCPGAGELGSSFRVLFEVPRAAHEDFYRLPYPNDVRVKGGRVDVSGFPRPPLYAVPTDLMSRYVAAIGAEETGFGPNESVFLRLSAWPLKCAANCAQTSSCAAGCFGPGEPEPVLHIVDITDPARSTFSPVWYAWQASSAAPHYICGPWLAVMPLYRTPWEVGHTYIVFVHTRLKSADNQAMTQDSDFEAMLLASAPADPVLAAAHAAYAPLRAWLAAAPIYPQKHFTGVACPNGNECTSPQTCDPTAKTCAEWCRNNDPCPGTHVCDTTAHICMEAPVTVSGDDLGAAALFTIRDPTAMLSALGDAVATLTPAASGLVACTAASAVASCSAPTASVVEVQGKVALPVFQEGTAPYAAAGGGISVDGAGVPQVVRTEDVRFALSVPQGTIPPGGWPVVIYAHGTGGDYRSHLTEGLAEAFATAAHPAAVLGIDQVANGARRGSATASSETLFFNVANPSAAKGNSLQGAVDQMTLARAVPAVSAALSALAGMSGATLDGSKIAFVGHSQGATVGALAMAKEPKVGATVFSGAGGGLLDALAHKTSPYPMAAIVRMVLADPGLEDFRAHPALSLIQGYLDDVDAINFGRKITLEPAAGGNAKHLLHLVGIGDTYTPNQTAAALALRWAPGERQRYTCGGSNQACGIYVGGAGTDFDNPRATPPLTANFSGAANVALTVAVSVHQPAAGSDGHFVLFDDAKAQERAVAFLAAWLDTPAIPPTVVP
ncbi:MAG: hypothetical protein HY903_24475 [Deltaproteobacteria bacterium]|nr:hypothetical protein [Deltaproteobacteria bacterium]